MKVFISWSGTRSQRIGEIFRVWLPSVLQAIVPYFTPSDIDKGTRWASDIAGQLETSDVGLLILTPENVTAQWMLFEAGALSKKLDASKVCPILFGMEPSDLTGPLTQFQLTVFSKHDILRLMTDLNVALGSRSLETSIFDNIFDTFWPNLETRVKEVMKQDAGSGTEPKRKEREIMEEVLELTRTMAVQVSQVDKAVRSPPRPAAAVSYPETGQLAVKFGELLEAMEPNYDVIYYLDQLKPIRESLITLTTRKYGNRAAQNFPKLFTPLQVTRRPSSKQTTENDEDDGFTEN